MSWVAAIGGAILLLVVYHLPDRPLGYRSQRHPGHQRRLQEGGLRRPVARAERLIAPAAHMTTSRRPLREPQRPAAVPGPDGGRSDPTRPYRDTVRRVTLHAAMHPSEPKDGPAQGDRADGDGFSGSTNPGPGPDRGRLHPVRRGRLGWSPESHAPHPDRRRRLPARPSNPIRPGREIADPKPLRSSAGSGPPDFTRTAPQPREVSPVARLRTAIRHQPPRLRTRSDTSSMTNPVARSSRGCMARAKAESCWCCPTASSERPPA